MLDDNGNKILQETLIELYIMIKKHKDNLYNNSSTKVNNSFKKYI
jgi:hypothetical protein